LTKWNHSILPIVFSVILLSGISQQSYALTIDNNPPDYAVPSQDCHVGWKMIPSPIALIRGGDPGPGCTLSQIPPELECTVVPASSEVGITSFVGAGSCRMGVPNYVDTFDNKLIRVQAGYIGITPPSITGLSPLVGNCILGERVDLPGSFFQDIICWPNPEFETIEISFDEGTELFEVIVDSISFDRNAVGGNIIPLDSTMVLAAGAQYTAAWMIPAIVSAIGIAIVIARKF